MDFPFNVCTDCFERSGKSKSKVPLLLASECLEKTRHKCVTVRVRLVDGILDPEIRPVPKAHFTGEFVLCDPKKCHRNRGNCKYPHCLKEKAAWNAEKFGVSAIFSPVTPTSSSASAHATEGNSSKEDEPKDPWPDYSGFGALTMEELRKGPHQTISSATKHTVVPVTTSASTVSPQQEVWPPSGILTIDTGRLPLVPWQPPPPPPSSSAPQLKPSYANIAAGKARRSSLSPLASPQQDSALAVSPQLSPVQQRQTTPAHLKPQMSPQSQPASPPQQIPLEAFPAFVPQHMSHSLPTSSALQQLPLQPTHTLPVSQPQEMPLEARPGFPPHEASSLQSPKNASHSTTSTQQAPIAVPQAKRSPAIPGKGKSEYILHKLLATGTYLRRFHELLKLEQTAHAKLLKDRCDGKYKMCLLQAGQTPGEVRVDAKPDHFRFGYIKGMGCDEVGYATQSASGALITIGSVEIKCDILRENMYHSEERLYIAFSKEVKQMLLTCLGGEKTAFVSPTPLPIHFLLKYSYFRSLKNSIRDVPKSVISRILPQTSSFPPTGQTVPLETSMLSLKNYCSPDQYEALKVIASTPASGPPVLIAGPFGTGKTRVLAIAAHYFYQKSVEDGSRLAILVCTQQHVSADAFLTMYTDLTPKKENITIIRLIPKYYSRRNNFMKHFYTSVDNFRKDMERNSHRNRLRYLIVTTCLTAKRIGEDPKVLPQWFFTHIFLDEGAQMREPEAVAPLCSADENTKLVIAGDRFQVGPAMLVLGEEPQKYGLSVSLLERLYDLYQELGDVAKPYCAHLSTNFRCHSAILNLARQVAYKTQLRCNVPDHSVHPDAQFPLLFLCTSLDHNVKETRDSLSKIEVNAALEKASCFFMKWPDNTWGKRDLRQICFLSPCRGQVTLARDTREKDLPPQVRSIQKLATYNIQGQEFRALFVSTSEPTTPEGETRDSTKSISDPAVFITAITRARSLVAAVGNPFMLLRREEHMVKKYGDRGHCWSLFLKACIDHGTLSVHNSCKSSPGALALLEKMINDRVSKICVLEPVQSSVKTIEAPPTIDIVPSTPTQMSPTAVKPTEEERSTESHEFREYVVKEKLGKGGFGVVCRVQSKIDKSEYALKIVRIKDKPEKVMREVEALAQLSHSNIVRYYHSWKEKAPRNWQHISPWKHLPSSDSASYPSERLTGETVGQTDAQDASATISPHVSSHSSGQAAQDDSDSNVTFRDTSSETQHLNSERGMRLDPQPPVCLCIKTELCQKETLKTWLNTNRDNRSRVEITNWFLELLEGVKFIHRHSLIHRDLKPSNIFFSRSQTESERKIKIGDFGLVTTSQVALGEAVPPKSHYVVGTGFYVSPEQNKRIPYAKEVDIYALGIIYFEMNRPFGTESERCKVLSTLRNRRSFPPGFEVNLPNEAGIIEWMLTEDPNQRPSAENIASSPRKKKLVKNAKKSKGNVPLL